MKILRLTFCILFCIALAGMRAASHPQNAGKQENALPSPLFDETEVKLDRKASLEALGVPTSEVLRTLSVRSGLRLTAGRPFAERRVTLIVHERPVREILEKLAFLFSHGTTAEGKLRCHWEIRDGGDADTSGLHLLPGELYAAHVREERERPRQELGRILRRLRDYVVATDPEKKRWLADGLPPSILDEKDGIFRLYHSAFRALDDEEIDLLVQGKSVPMSPNLFTADMAVINAERKRSATQYRNRALSQGRGAPEIPPDWVVRPPVRLRVTENTNRSRSPADPVKFVVLLEGVLDDFAMTLSTTRRPNNQIIQESNDPPKPVAGSDAASRSDLEKQSPALYDLWAVQADAVRRRREKTPDRFAKMDGLPSALLLYATATGRDIYEEHFYKTGLFGSAPGELRKSESQGTAANLLDRIARWYGYEGIVQRTPAEGQDTAQTTCLIWSQAWVFDAEADLPERVLIPWISKQNEQGELSPEDWERIAAQITWPQFKNTFWQALHDAVPARFLESLSEIESEAWWPDFALANYLHLRILGLLTKNQLASASSDEGLAVRNLSAPQIKAVTQFVVAGQPGTDEISPALRARVLRAYLRVRPTEGYLKPTPPTVEIIAR